ncbi:ribonuclease domain-containing protein [Nocardioides jiangxiensis]|uniref:Ribonuclease domain-containing protein n=1 Tax=Nocardioides jiangxiensis TaxID=3064524 RepID=A0ABT9B4T2_9ACTN|nr:ribonuclease domain-containing protein [Nocardioides sp. WY-20]MDO7869324.1 ribonuclease domain-containing protein [Nocardioides sp. WY-20]
MRLPRTRSQWVAAVLALVVALATYLWQQHGTTDTSRPTSQQSVRVDPGTTVGTPSPDARSSRDGTDPTSGLPLVRLSGLPAEAGDTVALIDSDGPFPYDRDGVVFGNYEGILPEHERGYYHEYTVPTPGESDRGARRIIEGEAHELYYTGDHYASFERISR